KPRVTALGEPCRKRSSEIGIKVTRNARRPSWVGPLVSKGSWWSTKRRYQRSLTPSGIRGGRRLGRNETQGGEAMAAPCEIGKWNRRRVVPHGANGTDAPWYQRSVVTKKPRAEGNKTIVATCSD